MTLQSASVGSVYGRGAGTTHTYKTETHPALHAAGTGFCAVVHKPV